MKREIEIFKSYKINGFVFGILDDKNRLDLERMKEILDLARPFSCVLHRAVDYSLDLEDKMDQVIDLGFKRILTSGKKPMAVDGLELLARLEKNYGSKIEIMVGSGVNFENIKEIYQKTKIENFHTSARSKNLSDQSKSLSYTANLDLIKKARFALYDLTK